MKIISKYKDYYDYLQGVYGVDEKLILDRKEFTSLMFPPSNKIETFFICNYKVQGIWIDGKIYFGDDCEQFANKPKEVKYKYKKFKDDKESNYWSFPASLLGYRHEIWGGYNILKKPLLIEEGKSPNKELKCPILRVQGREYEKNPILREYEINKVFTPEEIWILLSTWLGREVSDNEKEVPIGDDKVRISSHGFDLKTSFRNV